MLRWKDGQPWSARFDDRCFSADSGIGETRHVFLQGNRLAERFAALHGGQVFRIVRPGASLATYTSAGWVRRGLQRAGFDVRRVPGFGRKREMLIGSAG